MLLIFFGESDKFGSQLQVREFVALEMQALKFLVNRKRIYFENSNF